MPTAISSVIQSTYSSPQSVGWHARQPKNNPQKNAESRRLVALSHICENLRNLRIKSVAYSPHPNPLPAGEGTNVLIEEPNQLLAAAGLLQLANSLRLDLADALARDLEYVADFFQRVAVAVAQAVAELDDLALAVAQRL